MHQTILGARSIAAWALACTAAALPALALGAGGKGASAPSSSAPCPGPGAWVVEQLMPADCEECWARPPARAALPRQGGWRFDWIAPASGTGDDQMAAAALTDAAERAERAQRLAAPPGGASGPADGPPSGPSAGILVTSRLPAPAAVRLKVQSGPAWQGYFGLQLSVAARRALPAGSSAWLALVEQVPADSAGSPLARSLVRSVVGPLPLPAPGAAALVHRHALRWPASARPERLQARAWVEGPDGRLLAVAADRCGGF